jgi:3-dehydrosphinganine reductase
MRVDGVHAVVTGGSQGIGLEVARQLTQRGARVSIIARDPARLDAAVTDLRAGRSGPERVGAAAADVTDPAALRVGLERAVGERGPCELLVAAAGAAHPGYFEHLDAEVFRDQMELDYFGTLHAVRAVLPGMLARGRGGLVAVSSGAALIGVFGYGAYAPAKFAVRGLMETLRAEYQARGIYSACAFPPDTLTPGFEAENRLKPPETAAVSAGIKPRTAAAVAAAIVKGIERGQHAITADPQTALLAHGGSPVAAFARRQMAAVLRKREPS